MKIPAKYVCKPLYYFYKALCATLKITEKGRALPDKLHSEKKHFVVSLWHDELFPLMTAKRHYEIFTLVSQSRDGAYLAGVLELLGLGTVRGSSSKGGVKALLQAAKIMETEHKHACITVDGPRGPRHLAKQGAVFLAAHTGAYIVPARIFMDKSFKFNSWDKFQIPYPFSKVEIVFGEPYLVPDLSALPEEQKKDFLNAETEKLNSILNNLI